MTGRTLLTGAAVLASAFMTVGCGDRAQNSNGQPTNSPSPAVQTSAANNSDHHVNAAPRSPDRDPVQDSLRTVPNDSGTRAISQERAAADNADKQAADSKQNSNGIAKPIGDNQTIGDSEPKAQVDSADTHPVTNAAESDTVVSRNANTTATDKPRAVDNSGQNETDKLGNTMTPMDQGNSEADIGVTRTIRKALTDDASLSTNAKNLKIITLNGVVVLRGPVASQAEAATVLRHARTATDASRIENQMAVAAP